MEQYYFIDSKGQQQGPMSLEELAEKNIQPHTPVWTKGMNDWMKAHYVDEVREKLWPNMQNQATPPPSPQNPPRLCPKTYLLESILATIFCCLPLGVVGIVYAAAVETAFNRGDYIVAEENSRMARRFFLISLWVGIGIGVLYLLFMLGIFAFSLAGVTAHSVDFCG